MSKQLIGLSIAVAISCAAAPARAELLGILDPKTIWELHQHGNPSWSEFEIESRQRPVRGIKRIKVYAYITHVDNVAKTSAKDIALSEQLTATAEQMLSREGFEVVPSGSTEQVATLTISGLYGQRSESNAYYGMAVSVSDVISLVRSPHSLFATDTWYSASNATERPLTVKLVMVQDLVSTVAIFIVDAKSQHKIPATR
jgi:hypothetical protein